MNNNSPTNNKWFMSVVIAFMSIIIALLIAQLASNIALGNKIDGLSNNMSVRFDATNSRLDAMNNTTSTRFDAMNSRLDTIIALLNQVISLLISMDENGDKRDKIGKAKQ